MFSKVFLTIASCLIAIISCNVQAADVFEPNTEEYKEAYFARQIRQNVKVRNSAYQSPCFSVYFPKLEGLNEAWADNDAQCKSNASAKYEVLSNELEQYKVQLNGTADDVVNDIVKCESMVNVLDSINCTSTLSTSQKERIFEMSNTASIVLSAFSVQSNAVKDDLYACTNATQREYAKQSNKVYQQLNYCLIYGPEEVEAAPAPTIPITPATPPTFISQ